MSTVLGSHDSLPYIDTEPSAAERAKASDLIAAQLPIGYSKSLHPSLQALPDVKLTPTMEEQYQRKNMNISSKIRGGVDTSRYEAPDELSGNADVTEWQRTLRNAYSSATYLSNRHESLALLEDYGKNAWLISNSQLELILRDLQKELDLLKTETEEVNRARKNLQEASRNEIVALEEAWRSGIGRIIEVQVATAGLRQEVQQRRRASAR